MFSDNMSMMKYRLIKSAVKFAEAGFHIFSEHFQFCRSILSLSLNVPLAYLCINDLGELSKKYSQLTTGYCIEMQSGYSAVPVSSYEATNFILQIYNFRFKINVGSFGGSD